MIDLRNGDSIDVLKTLDADSVDAVVTDPPYGLAFMGKKWDYEVPSVELWREVFRVLKPGGHLLSFGGTRTYHRMVVNIEDAGFEIRDQIQWLYGSGFPKSHNLKEEWEGWGTALKPANEPIVLARKPFNGTVAKNVLKHGTGALNVDGCRVSTDDVLSFGSRELGDGVKYGKCTPSTEGVQNDKGRWPANVIHDGSEEVLRLFPNTKKAAKTVNADDRMGDELFASGDKKGGGRRNPENSYADEGSAARFFYCAKPSKKERNAGLEDFEAKQYSHDGRNKEIENAYQRNKSKASNFHPTVKPISLMRYLCRLITPPNGVVLDPFTGSGTTGIGATLEGFNFVGIERDEEYFELAKQRLAHWNK